VSRSGPSAISALAAVVVMWVTCVCSVVAAPPAAPSQPPAPPFSEPPTEPTSSDASVALERIDADRIRSLEVLAEKEARRLRHARTPESKISPIQLEHAGSPSVVLLSRTRPYTIPEVAAGLPESVSEVGPGTWSVREPILVAAGASLTITSDQVTELRLLSTPGRFTSIVGWKAAIRFAGSTDRRIRVTSWDPATGASDVNGADGRAYVLAKGGELTTIDADFSRLGFATGESSGVAWRGWPGEPSRGTVTGSSFVANYFGAYTFEAVAMRWAGNLFADNDLYGFDPHDDSNGFVVTNNEALSNGSHGFIFSRGCTGNDIRSNLSMANTGGGIVIDDGRVAEDGDPRHAAAVPSSDNVIEGNVALFNRVGIGLQGGSSNVVRGNLIAANRLGVQATNHVAATSVIGNVLANNSVMGIDLEAGSSDTVVSGNVIIGGKVGVAVGAGDGDRVTSNEIAGILGRGIILEGPLPGVEVSDNLVSGQGSSSIDAAHATSLAPGAIAGNLTAGWTVPRETPRPDAAGDFVRRHPAIIVWALVLLVPIAWWIPARRRRLFSRVRSSDPAR
jgi:parallel beta-helix repeat protein